MRLGRILDLTAEILRQAKIDYFDMSLWDVSKEPEDEAHKGTTLLGHFARLPRGMVRLGAAGKVTSAQAAMGVIQGGFDFTVIGRAAILRHDFPERIRCDPSYESPTLPVATEDLLDEGLSEPFIAYMRGWPGFVAEGEKQV